MKFKIYKLTNLDNGMIYVGRTERTVEERFQEHSWNKKSLIGRAIRAHGKDRFSKEILAECDDFNEANELERRFITEFNCKKPNGYNQTDGGDGREGCPHTPEECAKISAALKGKSNGREGTKHSASTKQKIAIKLTGHEVPKPVRDKISVKLTGRKTRPRTNEEKARIAAGVKASWAKRKAQKAQ